jgi:ABC-type transporter Mla MlaB component
MESTLEQSQAQVQAQPKRVNINDIKIADETTALNVLVAFVELAQRRGCYSIDESSKIWECIKIFQRPQPQPEAENSA